MHLIEPTIFVNHPALDAFFRKNIVKKQDTEQLEDSYLQVITRNSIAVGSESITPCLVAIILVKFTHFKLLLDVFITRHADQIERYMNGEIIDDNITNSACHMMNCSREQKQLSFILEMNKFPFFKKIMHTRQNSIFSNNSIRTEHVELTTAIQPTGFA